MRAIPLGVVFTTVVLLAGMAPPSPAQQVFKCQRDGQTAYSDHPCGPGGTTLDPDALRSNSIQGVPQQPAASTPVTAPALNEEGTTSRCLSPQEIRNLETSASSISLKPLQKYLKQADVELARKCEPLMTDAEKRQIEADYRAGRGNGALIPRSIVSCNRAGCTDDIGDRYYQRAGIDGSTWTRASDGRMCNRDGNLMMC